MIEVQGLTRHYGNVVAVEDLNFHIEQGEVVGFLGPNGAGKTTTMRMLTGYLPPTAGTARVAGYDVFTQSLEARRHIGYMPETVPLYPEMTVWSYLDFMARLRRVPNRDEAIERALETCHVTDKADEIIGHLSKGYRQRVGLAQALLHDPEVLILDEPTIGLDPKQIIEVRSLIKELGQERTVILSTHILPEVSQVCNRVLIINQGHIVADATPEELAAQLQGAERLYLRVREATPALAQALNALDGVASVEEKDGGLELIGHLDDATRAAIARTVVQGGWDLLEMRPIGMTLEEVFLQLTMEE
ncbi:MAG: ABC transporter ATP-binding protein [Chloroflexi bacterium]|nr:MAG: ABC transporter ATP-binding protein [Chloroflexota bacterium]